MRPNQISIIAGEFGWTVQVVENGFVTEQTFTVEKHAMAWASGQQIRLELHEIDHQENTERSTSPRHPNDRP
ncbi:hypothetical protein DTW90_37160 [Neorhizobium sp. P12A]|nr:hypothetical protein DTW90_37160 [Neorhizobium sp. P12A]